MQWALNMVAPPFPCCRKSSVAFPWRGLSVARCWVSSRVTIDVATIGDKNVGAEDELLIQMALISRPHEQAKCPWVVQVACPYSSSDKALPVRAKSNGEGIGGAWQACRRVPRC